MHDVEPIVRDILRADNRWIDDPGALATWAGRGLPEPFVPRTEGRRAATVWEAPGTAHIVVGPRQAGKSTLLRKWLADRGQPYLFVDCEQLALREWCRSPPLLLRDVSDLTGEPPLLYFDEVQHLEDAALFLKGLVDRGHPAPIFATGSSSWHLRSATRESLAGRATRTRLLPFSLREVTQDLDAAPPALRDARLEERFAVHVVAGGYPRAWLSDRPEDVLVRLVEAFVLRDASDLFAIARPDAFRRLMRLVAGQAGSLVNHSEWAQILGVSRDTVSSYLQILADSHVLTELPPFAAGRRVEVTSRPKVYFVDPGLRNVLLGDMRPWAERVDRGPLLESWVLSEILKALPPAATLHFWRTGSGAEVDFVVSLPDAVVAIECKAQPLRRPTLPRACRSFVDAYAPRTLLLVNGALDHEETLGETTLRWIPAHRLPAVLEAALSSE